MLQRDFKHLAVDLFLEETEEGQKQLRVDCHFGKRKSLASIRTCVSHVQVRARERGGCCGAGASARSAGEQASERGKGGCGRRARGSR